MKPALITICVVAVLAGLAFLISNNLPQTPSEPAMQTTPNSAFKTTPLHTAAENGELEKCQSLLAKGADVNAFDEVGWSPLILAVMNDHTELARFLLNSGAKMHYRYQREDTPEERAKETKQEQALEKELDTTSSMKETFKDLPADILADLTSEKAKQEMIQDMVDLHFEPTSIHAIEYCVKLETLELLVTEFNADINHVGDDGYWPLLSFAEIENMEAVTWLLKHKADPNNTATGGTAIFKAVQNDDLEMTKLFIKHGAKINVQDVDGWTVLFACQSLQMAQYLIEQGADPTTLDQAAFPCWSFVDDPATKAYLKKIATQQGLKDWTEIPK